MSTKFLLLFALVLLIALVNFADEAEAGRKKKKSKGSAGGPGLEQFEQAVNEAGETEIKFKSEEEKNKIIEELAKEQLKGKKVEDKPAPVGEALQKLKKEEGQIRFGLSELKADPNEGEFTKKYWEGLYMLGRNLFSQNNWAEARIVARKIVQVTEILYGREDAKLAQALANYGSTCFRTNEFQYGRVAMNRALNILINIYSENSKEVMAQRGKMLSFGMNKEEGEKGKGFTYEEYEDYIIDDIINFNADYE
jgi:hypothetical protein